MGGDAVIIAISQKMNWVPPPPPQMVIRLPKVTELMAVGSPLLTGPVSGCLTVVMGHQATVQMVSFTGWGRKIVLKFKNAVEDSPRIAIFCFDCFTCLLCSWPRIHRGIRDGLTGKNKLRVTSGHLGPALGKDSFSTAPGGTWISWVQTPRHLLWLHIFGVLLNLSPGILDPCLLPKPQKPCDLESPAIFSPVLGQAYFGHHRRVV